MAALFLHYDGIPMTNALVNAADIEALPNDMASLVLLVDDQPIVGEAVRRLLMTAPDIDLHYCSHASEAITIAEQLRPTVILQDLVLPDIDGLEMVRRFRANRPTAITPIVVLSTKEEPIVKSQAFSAGANDYLVKLPDKVELIARIRYHSHAYIAQLQRDEAFKALRESQRQLLQTNTTLLSLNQQLNEFVGVAAHDLRNPLGVVLGFTKYLMRDATTPFTEQQRNFLSTIQSSAEFMLRLVNDLLDVAKIEAGELRLHLQPTNLCSIVETNIKLNRILAKEKRIEIAFHCAPTTPPIMADPHRIEQVLNNLMMNAIKFSYPNTRIDVKVGVTGGNITLAVCDQGQGIPPEELNTLFLPFGVTSVRGTSGEKSTGLGLMIAKKVVDAHGGHISVESIPGKGSTFLVTFPLETRTQL
jgi:signal transduction histidine kinase